MKDCLIIGACFGITYDEIVDLFKEDKIRAGYTTSYYFVDDSGNTIRIGECFWYTTLTIDKTKMLRLAKSTKTYNESDYPKYDDLDAINVNSYKDIPVDYDGPIGVPASYLLRGNNDNYEILYGPLRPKLNGKTKFPRVIIRRKGE